MIRFSVEDYCHDCPDFEAEVNKTLLRSNSIVISTDTCITCKHKDKCLQIYRYMMATENKKGDKTL